MAVVTKVVDGDTVGVRARIWLGQDVETLVRLRGIDAPELHSRCADERDRARDARDMLARRVDGQVVQLLDIGADKYGNRVVARLLTGNGQDLSRLLLDAGLAHVYDGGAKTPWCDN